MSLHSYRMRRYTYPRTPPSSRITFRVMPQTESSAFGIARSVIAAGWPGTPDTGDRAACAKGIDAVAMDKRDRTRSNGYVEPKNGLSERRSAFIPKGRYEQTEVIPASAPLAKRWGVPSSLEPWVVNHCA